MAIPKGWKRQVRLSVLNVISLAQFAMACTRGWAANSPSIRVRLKVQVDRLTQEMHLLQEEIRIKDTRMESIEPHRRPYYKPTQRMAILELRAARGWTLKQTADTFQITAATVASWMKRLDQQGSDALVALSEPVNKFPDFVRYAVKRLKTLCPAMGKKGIAQTLARAGLHLGTTTVGRMLMEVTPWESKDDGDQTTKTRVVTSKSPNHTWHIDLTIVPIGRGFWSAWSPFAFPQRFPFGWWVAAVLDHYSRRVIGFSVYESQPNGTAIRRLLGRLISQVNSSPKYLITDKGRQFWKNEGYDAWCTLHKIKPRFGAIGKHGSIAVIERFILTMKNNCTRRLIVPLRRDGLWRELKFFFHWYNSLRPHSSLKGRAPDEVYFHLKAANQRPRVEPRKHWPRRSVCAKPNTLVAGQPGDKFVLDIDYYQGRTHLPVVTLKRAA